MCQVISPILCPDLRMRDAIFEQEESCSEWRSLSAWERPQTSTSSTSPLHISTQNSASTLPKSLKGIHALSATLIIHIIRCFNYIFLYTASIHKTNLILQFTILQFRFIMHSKKTAFIVEHDFIMATYMADKVLVFEGQPGFKCTAHRYFYVKEILNLITSLVQ